MEELKELRAGLQRETGHLIRIQRQNRGQDEAAMMQTARLIVKASGKFVHCVDARARKDVILGILSSITFKDKAITGYTLRPGALWASDQQCADGLSIPLDEPIALGPAACPIEAGTRKCRKCGETKWQTWRRLEAPGQRGDNRFVDRLDQLLTTRGEGG